MKIAILGAGAMGCMLAKAAQSPENEVNLVDPYEAHMKKIEKDGIKIINRAGGECVVKVDYAKTDSKDLDIQDVVVILVKGYDTEKILRENMNLVGDKTIVMTLQNGIGNVDIIRNVDIKEENIAQGIMFISASIEEPGVISAGYDSDKTNIIFGAVSDKHDDKVFKDIEKAFNKNEIITELNPDVDRIMWRKLYINAIYNLPCAVMHLSTKYTRTDENSVAILKKISDEFIAVTDKLGYNFDGDKLFRKYVTDAFEEYGDILPSAAQDTQKHRKTEAEFLNGAIVRQAKKLGLEAPVNETIYRLAMVQMNNYDNRF
ncbi:ketopantoate reductase family protein [uncultured Finegoldia sp.]|uniref:ketopantoate reductase family protein n=1 Tax=uncultured Finegoldia sp. TaxID=328009 RepID=UPI002631C657|nr:2-dehydropantoate 2-reductase [uncultured Finegoldia sp.]